MWMIVDMHFLVQFSSMLPLCREPISSANVLTSTNEAYELVKQAGKGGKCRLGVGRDGTRDGGGEEGHDYEVISPAQPVQAGEIPLQS